MSRTWQVTRGQFIVNYVAYDELYSATLYYQYDAPRVRGLQGFTDTTLEGLQQKVKNRLVTLSQEVTELIDATSN